MGCMSQPDDRPYGNAQLYKIILDATDLRCIAPTLKKGNPRCRVIIKDAEALGLISDLFEAITQTDDADEIRAAVLQLISLRCCIFGSHRVKLGAEPLCRNKLAAAYIAELRRQGLLQVEVPSLECLAIKDSLTEFIPYITDAKLSIELVLRSEVNLEPRVKGENRRPKLGVVYVLTLPSHPELVKIGYSGYSADARCEEWSKCFPRAAVAKEIEVAYPERMEELIHLQLREHRRQIAKCATCSRGHIELFEMTEAEAILVMLDWAELLSLAPLYDDCQVLSEQWSAILHDPMPNITARVLLDAYNLSKKLQDTSEEANAVMLRSEHQVKREELEVGAELESEQQHKKEGQKPAIMIKTEQQRLVLDEAVPSKNDGLPTPSCLVKITVKQETTPSTTSAAEQSKLKEQTPVHKLEGPSHTVLESPYRALKSEATEKIIAGDGRPQPHSSPAPLEDNLSAKPRSVVIPSVDDLVASLETMATNVLTESNNSLTVESVQLVS